MRVRRFEIAQSVSGVFKRFHDADIPLVAQPETTWYVLHVLKSDCHVLKLNSMEVENPAK